MSTVRSGVALLIFGLSCHGADLYRMAGTVINAQTGSPVSRAHLYVTADLSVKNLASMVTGDDGAFHFDLPEGKYHLRGGLRELPQTFGLGYPGAQAGTSVILGPGQSTDNLVFRWFPPAAISGRIVDVSGDPVENALVQLVRVSVAGGRRFVYTFAWHRTNDLGEYRFGPIPGGAYYLAVTGVPWFERSAGAARAESNVGYLPAYYPGNPDMAKAAPLTVKAGEEGRADFVLSSTAGATVFVKYDPPNEMTTGLLSLIPDGIGGSDALQRQESAHGGQHELKGVPPGRYIVRVTCNTGSSDFSARQTIDVQGSDIHVDLTLRPYPTVSGSVKFKRPGAKPKGTVLVSLVREGTGRSITTRVRADGSFVFPSVATGQFRPTIRGTDGYFASRVEAQGTELRNGILDLQDGDSVTLAIIASDEIADVKGFVIKVDHATAGAMVVLAPVTDSADPQQYRGFLSDSDGSFDFRNVPAGEYLMFAVEDSSIEYTSPVAVRPYLAGAMRIRIDPHGSYTERVPLALSVDKQ